MYQIFQQIFKSPGSHHREDVEARPLCPNSTRSVVSSSKPPPLHLKHYFVIFCLFFGNSVLLFFFPHWPGSSCFSCKVIQPQIPEKTTSLFIRISFCKTEISYFCIFYCGEFDCKLFFFNCFLFCLEEFLALFVSRRSGFSSARLYFRVLTFTISNFISFHSL